MPTNYPDGIDRFTEPADPANTPLSSAGTGNRNHIQSHIDLGDAIEALQAHASKATHLHSGSDGSSKLLQAHTHEGADTDSRASAIHHTLGKGEFQAAAGNHSHDFNNADEILNAPIVSCTTTTRPRSPILGMLIYETDTNTVRSWSRMPNQQREAWNLLPAGNVPYVQLRQGKRQSIYSRGVILEWLDEEEDTFGMFDTRVSTSSVKVKEPGVYDIAASISWNPSDIFGDYAVLGLVVNGVLTNRVVCNYLSSNGFNMNLVQTIDLNTSYRFKVGDEISIRAWHYGSFASWTIFNATLTNDRRDSTLIVKFVAP